MHTAVVTHLGELYTWGHDRTGCLGLSRDLYQNLNESMPNGRSVTPSDILVERKEDPPMGIFVSVPTPVESLFLAPTNLARGPSCTVQQSSTFNRRGPEIAVNGETRGDSDALCTSTQVEIKVFFYF